MEIPLEVLQIVAKYTKIRGNLIDFIGRVCEELNHRNNCDDYPLCMPDGICVRHTNELYPLMFTHFPELFI